MSRLLTCTEARRLLVHRPPAPSHLCSLFFPPSPPLHRRSPQFQSLDLIRAVICLQQHQRAFALALLGGNRLEMTGYSVARVHSARWRILGAQRNRAEAKSPMGDLARLDRAGDEGVWGGMPRKEKAFACVETS